MKGTVLFFLLLIAQFGKAFALPSDSTTRTGKFRNFNIAFNWGEFGGAYALPVKQFENLPEEVDAYLSTTSKGTSFGFLGVTFFYKHTFGVGVTYNYIDFTTESNSYQDYIISNYPDYYPPKTNYGNYTYSIDGLLLNFSYRKPFRYFFIESIFRVGFNTYDGSGNGFQLKKKGANEYLRVGVNETYTDARNSYQLHFSIAHRFKGIYDMNLKFELGARTSFYVTPISSVFTFEQEPYGGTITSNSYAVDRLNPALGGSVFINCYF